MKKNSYSSPISRLRRKASAWPLQFIWLTIVSVIAFAGLAMRWHANAAPTAQDRTDDAIWTIVEPSALRGRIAPEIPENARTLRLNAAALTEVLYQAPREFTGETQQVILPLPLPDGSFARFSLEESSVLVPEVAAQYPEIKSYRGQSLDNPAMTMRCDWSPRGFHATLLSHAETITILPAHADDVTMYVSYAGQGNTPSGVCATEEADLARQLPSLNAYSPLITTGNNLRTYRIAIATTQEYTNNAQLGGGTVAGAIASLNTWINAVNVLYERDLAVRLLLVTNNALIYTAEPDGFTNTSEHTMLNEVTDKLRNAIGAANYDLGHVLGTGSAGVAGFGVVCSDTGNNKERGASRVSGPAGGGSTSLLAHEIGHQFGASHTHNATVGGSCPANRAGDTAYETGGGLSLMAYRGNCTGHSLDLGTGAGVMNFHAGSIFQIQTFLATTACAVTTATGNNPPTVSGGPDYTIPRSTPFTLTALGNDPDLNDLPNLTYAWQQVDAGGATFGNPAYNDQGDPITTTRPIFRPFAPTTNPARTFPSLNYILNNANTPPETTPGQFGQVFQTGEQLPRVSRQLNFRVVLRDNRAGGGGLNDDNVALTVDGASGPFLVTAPNTAVNWTVGSQQAVTWSVNNTNAAPINAANVRITLSIDGGQTFPFVLAASVPNNGTANVMVPNGLSTATARVKVEALGNIFFDISDVNFAINAGATCPLVTVVTPSAGNVGEVITLTGRGLTGVTAVQFSNNVAATVFNVVNDTTLTATVPAGAITGPLTLSKTGCTDVPTGVFAVCANPPATLQADDGTFESGRIGGIYANRLTPATYPATLRRVVLRFRAGTPATNFDLLTGTNPGGTANINDLPLQRTPATLAGGDFVAFDVPPITIVAGDFIVGCDIPFAAGQFPILIDTTAQQTRSYLSTDASTWSPFTEGNLPIRAQIVTGCAGGATCQTVTGLATNNGTVGASVIITGTNLLGVTAVRFSNNVNAAFIVNNDNQITATVPNGAVTGVITLVRPNCPDAQTGTFTVNPITCGTVTGINPLRAQVGDAVTITGTGFTGISIVKFTNEVSANFTVNSDTQITATVPPGATPGPISLSKIGCATLQTAPISLCNTPLVAQVDDGTQQGASSGFGQITLVNRLTPAGYPATLNSVVIRFNPFQQIPTGTNFTIVAGANPNGGANVDATAFQQVNTQVGALNQFVSYNLTTPITINAGDFVVGFRMNPIVGFPLLRNTQNPQGRSYSSNNGTTFALLEGNANLLIRANYTLGCGAGPACAAVTNLAPTTGAIGSPVVLTGTNFNGVTGVRFSNNVAAQFTVDSDTQITATVPAGAVTGPLTISKPACADVQTAAFTVNAPPTCPTVTNLAPTEDLVGAQITLTGTNFTGVTAVTFSNNQVATFNIVNDTTITATVPADAVTGPLTLTKPTCADTQTVDFIVLPAPEPVIGVGDGVAPEPDELEPGQRNHNGIRAVATDEYVMTFIVQLSGVKGFNSPISVNYATANGTAVSPNDYLATSGTLTFSPPFLTNTVTRSINVTLVGDDNFETNEDFFLNLSNNVNVALGDGQGEGMIYNEDCQSLTINPSSLPGGFVNTAYNQSLTTSGGTGPYDYVLDNTTTLPEGLTLSDNGVISGTPVAGSQGSYTFTVVAIDTNGCIGLQTYTIKIVHTVKADFDGDRKTDVSLWRPATGVWWIYNSATNTYNTRQWGFSNDVAVPGDYDGDGKIDTAVWRPADGMWWIYNSATNTYRTQQWGFSNDVPVPADYDGDGKTDVAVWRPSTGVWWIYNSATSTYRTQQWGFPNDKPVPGDYDGDGQADVAIWRPSDGTWWIFNSEDNTYRIQQWGFSNDKPVAGDYDGDGKTDVAVWRPSTGIWWIFNSATNTFRTQQWGFSNDVPVPGDYDGDGKTDTAVWRPGDGVWWIFNSATNTHRTQQWGFSADVPAPSK